ncbi:MAG: DedA family protein [Actinomycetota bacterium]
MISDAFDLVNRVVEELEAISSNPWFYLVIFVIAYFDSIFPVVPSETSVILGGIAAGQGNLFIVLVILAGAIGAYAGDTTTYMIGRRSGTLVTRWFFRGDKGAVRLERAGGEIRKRGGLLLITARFIPGGRTAVTFSCGLTKQPFWSWFTRWDLLAVFVWATYAGLIGFFFGDRFKDDHTTAFWWAFSTALSITVVIELVRWIRGRLGRGGDTDDDGDGDGGATDGDAVPALTD